MNGYAPTDLGGQIGQAALAVLPYVGVGVGAVVVLVFALIGIRHGVSWAALLASGDAGHAFGSGAWLDSKHGDYGPQIQYEAWTSDAMGSLMASGNRLTAEESAGYALGYADQKFVETYGLHHDDWASGNS